MMLTQMQICNPTPGKFKQRNPCSFVAGHQCDNDRDVNVIIVCHFPMNGRFSRSGVIFGIPAITTSREQDKIIVSGYPNFVSIFSICILWIGIKITVLQANGLCYRHIFWNSVAGYNYFMLGVYLIVNETHINWVSETICRQKNRKYEKQIFHYNHLFQLPKAAIVA